MDRPLGRREGGFPGDHQDSTTPPASTSRAPAVSLAFNREVYDSFTPTQQKIVEIASGEAHQWNLAQFLANNSAALARLQAAGVKTLEFPDSVWDAFAKAAQEVHDENLGDELYKRVYDSYIASMKSSSAWIKLSDGAYTAQRDRTLG